MNFKIRNFQNEADLKFADTLTQAENWRSETFQELKILYDYDPQGCFLGEQNGIPVAICVITTYRQYGFIGELIVSPDVRNMGIGKKMMEKAVDTLKNRGINHIFLDGVKKAIPLYERLGFIKIERSLRFFGQVQTARSSNVHPITDNELNIILNMDHTLFGEDRSFFLKRRLSHYPHLGYYHESGGKITSYLFAREGRGGWTTVGPWVSASPVEESIILLRHFQNKIGNQPFSMGVLESNRSVVKMIVMDGMIPQPDPPNRMGLTMDFNPGASPECFAIGSPAKG